jgi:hypothetical protein
MQAYWAANGGVRVIAVTLRFGDFALKPGKCAET